MPTGKIVHTGRDNYGNILVIDYPHQRILSFDSIYEQSSFYVNKPYALAHEYTRIMMLVLGYITPKHVTMIGLGGGSLLRSLHYCLPKTYFHVIELRQKVYDIAKEYFNIPQDDRVSYSIQNASEKVSTLDHNGTDVIFSDIYDAAGMDPLQVQDSFIKNCWQSLSLDGWLVINFHRLPDVRSTFFNTLKEYFGTIKICSGKEFNHIVFAGKPHSIDRQSIPEKIQKIELMIDQPFYSLYLRMNRIFNGS